MKKYVIKIKDKKWLKRYHHRGLHEYSLTKKDATKYDCNKAKLLARKIKAMFPDLEIKEA